MDFQSLGLERALVRAIEDQGYRRPTPIQARAIPAILSGRDVLASAQTGTGKTAGFTLPMLQRLNEASGRSGKHAPRALILCPTRELAAQVGAAAQKYGRHLPLRTTVIFGGVKIGPQIQRMQQGQDIVVATPGRLLDHLSQGTVSLSSVEFLVLDEADRMLDMGFIRDIRRIVKEVPLSRQTLMFSATFSKAIRTLADGMLQQPEVIDVAPRNATVERIRQRAIEVSKQGKRALLSGLIEAEGWYQVLVFTRTKHGANRLARQLQRDGHDSDAIHGNKSQSARTRTLEGFKAGKIRVLVATDIAARGLDIQGLPHVVNFELPNVAEDYVHRIGRTGRAGQSGDAVSLVSPDEADLLRDIEKLTGRPVPWEKADGSAAALRPAPAHDAPAARPARDRVGHAQPKPRRRKRVAKHFGNNRARGKPTGSRERRHAA